MISAFITVYLQDITTNNNIDDNNDLEKKINDYFLK